MRGSSPVVLACFILVVFPAEGQVRREIVTESTATVGRGGAFPSNDSFIAGITALADFGLRWTHLSGIGYGASLVAGRDFPNEATLAGVRLRASYVLGGGMLEGSLAAVASSIGAGGIGHADGLGASLGLAYYPASWAALVLQLDAVPTNKLSAPHLGEPGGTYITRAPAVSAGIRLAGLAGIVPWIGAALTALVWVVAHD